MRKIGKQVWWEWGYKKCWGAMVIVLRVGRLVCGQVQNYKLQTAKLQKAEILKNPKKVSSTQPPPTCGMGLHIMTLGPVGDY